jgi:hypothetical protein
MEVVSTTTTTDPVNMYDYLNGFVLNPMVFIIIALIIVGCEFGNIPYKAEQTPGTLYKENIV